MNTNIQSILIANRGEIAVRVIRTCRELGIRTVAVYSEADKAALFTRMADEAYFIGPPPSSRSYLRRETIIETALKTACDAIHPGYGFLSENPEFAEDVQQAGLVFIGPPAQAIRDMGDKTKARELMIAHGVPTIPGTEHAIETLEEGLATAEEIGFPVLIKAAAGGGGKGMRVIHTGEEFEAGMTASRNEARSAFGDERVYIEKYIDHPRHIEIQILADTHGNVIHLGERECSIQRRHQKVIEESPSAIVDEEMRRRMGEAARNAARACGYINAGTVEFLVDRERKFYFLEMNTRLQVEHPVTELVYQIDLVREQIRIAEGKNLNLSQDQIVRHGHAIECRLSAEDVRNSFLPSVGRLQRFRPPVGTLVRLDTGVEEGDEITLHYDPMFGKLIVLGKDRKDAIEKMRYALRDFRIAGVETTIPFCRFVMEHPAFISGEFDTHFIEDHFSTERLTTPSAEEYEAGFLASALLTSEYQSRLLFSGDNGSQAGRSAMRSGWKRRCR